MATTTKLRVIFIASSCDKWRIANQLTHWPKNTIRPNIYHGSMVDSAIRIQGSNNSTGKNPLAANVLLYQTYVDDVMTRADDRQSLIILKNMVINLLSSGRDLNYEKWS